jgi:hypothetical protein
MKKLLKKDCCPESCTGPAGLQVGACRLSETFLSSTAIKSSRRARNLKRLIVLIVLKRDEKSGRRVAYVSLASLASRDEVAA